LGFTDDILELADYASDLPAQFMVSYDGLTLENLAEFNPQNIVNYPNSTETYLVTYTYTNPDLCASFIEDAITVHPLPVSDFTVMNACEDTPIDFTSLSSVGSGTVSAWQWLIDDTPSSTEENLTEVSFENFGDYELTLVVESNQQCIDSLTQTITIYSSPEIALTAEDVCLEEAVLANANATILSGSITEIIYEWGDVDQESSLEPVQHIYDSWGDFLINVTATSDQNCVTSDSISIHIHPLPEADMIITNQCFGIENILVDSSTIAEGTITEAEWNIPSEGIILNGTSVNHLFSEPGIFNVELVATSSENCTTETTGTVQVFPSPTVDFSISNSPTCQLSQIILTNESDVEVPASITDLQWLVAGETYNENPLELVFEELQSTNVALTITTSDGCIETLTQTDAIEIYPLPVAGFVIDPNPTTIVNNEVQIEDTSLGANSWQYSISDGTTFTSSSTPHTFEESGTYEVLQIVSNEFGCIDSSLVIMDVVNSLIVYVPSAITLDNDGLNEAFFPVLFGDDIQEYEFTIWNRWGEQIFQSLDPTEKWYGNVKEGEHYAQNEVYTWRLIIKGASGVKNSRQGMVTVIR